MHVSITSNLDRLTADFGFAQREQVPFAAAKALTTCAETGRKRAEAEIVRTLQAPTAYITNAMYKKPATKRNLEASVYLKGWERLGGSRGRSKGSGSQADVLGHLFAGGSRRWKGFEAALMSADILPRDMAAVPGAGAQLNAHGNMAPGFIKQIVSYLRAAERVSGYTANMTDTGRDRFGKRLGKQRGIGGAAVQFFVSRGRGQWFGRRGWKEGRFQHLPPGIWMRAQSAFGTAIKPIIMFVRKPTYRQYFDLEQIVFETVQRDFDGEFATTFEQAMRSAGRLPGGASHSERSADFWSRAGR